MQRSPTEKFSAEDRYLSRFNSFFNSEKLSSTYKPVFVKSLIPISEYDDQNMYALIGYQWVRKEQDKLKVDLNFIAVRYIKFYWELYFKFKLRQSHTPQDVNINKILEKQNDHPKTPTLKTLASDEFSDLRKQVIMNSIKPEVLVHLDAQNDLYTRISGEDSIWMNFSLVSFFRKYKDILIPATNFMITRYLEKINFIPRVAEKVSGYIPRDDLAKEEWIILTKIDPLCFYCKKKPGIRKDHVIPFNYIFQTEIFNIVPACAQCNSIKSDKLPTKDFFNKVKDRNKTLKLRTDYTEDWYQKLYETCITSYHGTRPYFMPD